MLLHRVRQFADGTSQSVFGFCFFGYGLVHVLDTERGVSFWRFNRPRQTDQREWWA